MHADLHIQYCRRIAIINIIVLMLQPFSSIRILLIMTWRLACIYFFYLPLVSNELPLNDNTVLICISTFTYCGMVIHIVHFLIPMILVLLTKLFNRILQTFRV